MQSLLYGRHRQRLYPLMLLCVLTSLFALHAPPAQALQRSVPFAYHLRGGHFSRWHHATAPVDADCRINQGQPCYSPQEMWRAYNLLPVLSAGYRGAGQTIVIINSFGSPTALSDLQTFDQDYGLPDPPSFRVLAPLGSVPFNVNDQDQLAWAEETSLDVQWAHAMAPLANIVLLTSPISETQGLQGMPQFLSLELYALNHNLGTIISQSWGTTENTLFTPQGKQMLDAFNIMYHTAANMHVTVLASAGDTGSANPDINGNNYAFPTVGFPASSPYVTAVGGTSLYADSNGTYRSELVWNRGAGTATGGGISQYFHTPSYQSDALPQSTLAQLHGFRALPDISYNADALTSIPVYIGFLNSDQNGYYLFGGTSEGAPQWAGIIADGNQWAGHPLGFLNDQLYKLGKNANEYERAFHDIQLGDNSQKPVPGYSAGPGWDAVTGWGSPNALYLLKDLIGQRAL